MDVGYIDDLITIQSDNVSSSRKWTRFLIFGGGTLLLFAIFAWTLALQKRIDGNLIPSLVSMIGSFVSVCSLLPYKEITPGRLKLAKYKQLRLQYEKMKDLPDDERSQRIIEINKGLGELV